MRFHTIYDIQHTIHAMRILGIDPGFDRLGIAVVEKERGERERVLFSACVTTSAKDHFAKRLRSVVLEAARVMKEWKPDIVALETLLLAKNQKTAMRVAETRGALIYVAEGLGIPSKEYSPSQIKLSAGGHGRADKKDVERMVRLLVSFPKEDVLDDEIDAVAVALTALAHEKMTYPVRL